ncbi:MAG: hypothetical protein Q9227_003653 [Pyrenula ochraceoflavens]
MNSQNIPPYPVSPKDEPADNPWSTEESKATSSEPASHSTIARKPVPPQHTVLELSQKAQEPFQSTPEPLIMQELQQHPEHELFLPDQAQTTPFSVSEQYVHQSTAPFQEHRVHLEGGNFEASDSLQGPDVVQEIPEVPSIETVLPKTGKLDGAIIPSVPQIDGTYRQGEAYEHQDLIPPPLHPAHTTPTSTAPSPQPQTVKGLSGNSILMPPAPPPRRVSYQDDRNISDPLHYTRDPHKLVVYLVPFPKPTVPSARTMPTRFLIYTPPPPPLYAPPEGAKEGKVHKLQRKWETEVRDAKASKAKVTSWKGIKSRATKGVNWGMSAVKDSNLEFLNRVPASKHPNAGGKNDKDAHDAYFEDDDHEAPTTSKTVGLEEMVLIYPPEVPETQEEIRREFVESMLRTKSKATRDAIIATGLWPVALTIDIVGGPFGGLAEIDGVWAYASIKGAKTARSVTKRLTSTLEEQNTQEGVSSPITVAPEKREDASIPPADIGDDMYGPSAPMPSVPNPPQSAYSVMSSTDTPPKLPARPGKRSSSDPTLKLTFTPSPRAAVLQRYLATVCSKHNPNLFSHFTHAPVESDLIAAIGWSPSQTGGVTRNWEDEQWELQEVKDDLKHVFHKGAKEWGKWVKSWDKTLKKI